MIDNNLKFCREEMEMTQEELGYIFGVSRKTISGWETSSNIIPFSKLIKFCNLYDYSSDFVMGLTRRNNRNNAKIKTNKNLIGKKLKELRNNFNLSQEKFAKKCGLSQTTYSHYETGFNLITTTNAYSICKTYNVSIDWLVGRTNNYKINK